MNDSEKPTLDLAAIRARCEAATTLARLELAGGAKYDGALRDIATVAADVPALLNLVDTLTRALLAVEWRVLTSGVYVRHCFACGGDATVDPHFAGCAIDAALTAAGYPDAASRDAARARMKETP